MPSVGIIAYGVSMFKSEKALRLAIGGVFLVPMTMPHFRVEIKE